MDAAVIGCSEGARGGGEAAAGEGRRAGDQGSHWSDAAVRAAAKGHEAVVKLLLEKGAELAFKDYISQISVLLAAENRHEAVVKLLLEKFSGLTNEKRQRPAIK